MKKVGLVRRTATWLLALTMLCSVFTVSGFAEGDDEFWTPVSQITFDNAVVTQPVIASAYQWDFKSSGTSGDISYTLNAAPAYGRLGDATTYKDWETDIVKDWPTGYGKLGQKELPEVAGGKLFLLSRNGVGSWSSNRFPHRDSYANITAAMTDRDTVEVGDTVRITAYVYTHEIAYGTLAKASDSNAYDYNLVEDQDSATSLIRMSAEGREVINKAVPNHTWTPISVEYTITEDNIDSVSVKIDAADGTTDNNYAIYTFISGLKAEKLCDSDAAYEIGIKNYVESSKITLKGAAVKEVNANYSVSGADTTENGLTYTVNADCGGKRLDTGGTKFYDKAAFGDSEFGGIKGKTLPEISSGNLFLLSRKGIGTWNEARYPRRWSNMSVSGFLNSDIEVGDTVKVTAWLYTDGIYTGTLLPDEAGYDVHEVADQANATSGVRIQIENATKTDFYIANNMWVPVTVEYTVTQDNINKPFVIDADTGSGVDPYAMSTFLAGIKVEKLTEITNQNDIFGYVSTSAAPTGNNNMMIVAAYNEAGMLIGTDAFNYGKPGRYEFTIAGAADATAVKAYIWDMSVLMPQADSITVEKNI